ncbi:MAG: hypothetical protein EHM61_03775 [Acidobacteria bacterium]|nr:MAG: hypothetical protein EHM61_03775 [Acidobacteriota bacterium]
MALDPTLAWFAVMVMAFVMLLQSLVVFGILTKTAKQLRSSERGISSLLAGVEKGTASLRQLLSHAEGVPARLKEFESRAPLFLARMTQSVRTLDERAANFVERSRSYLYQFDSGADTILSNFSTQIFRVHRAVIHPAIRFSTLLQSVQAVAARVFPDEDSPAAHSPDQEIFI